MNGVNLHQSGFLTPFWCKSLAAVGTPTQCKDELMWPWIKQLLFVVMQTVAVKEHVRNRDLSAVYWSMVYIYIVYIQLSWGWNIRPNVSSPWNITFIQTSSKLFFLVKLVRNYYHFFLWVKSPSERLQKTNSHWNYLIYKSSLEQLLRNEFEQQSFVL